MNRIYYLIVAVLFFCSCSKSEMINFYETEPYVNFIKGSHYPRTVNMVDSIYACTVFANGAAEMYIDLPIMMSGPIKDFDRSFKIVLSESGSHDLIRGKHFEFDENPVLKANTFKDTVRIILKVNEIENDNIYDGRLRLELVENDSFTTGLSLYSYVNINVYGKYFPDSLLPTFWTLNNMDEYAGSYTSGKAGEFVKMHRIKNQDWYAPNKAILYEMARKTYKYLESNEVLDKDGNRVRFNGKIKF